MTSVSELLERNSSFATARFRADLEINPSGDLMVIGCVDPRVDPARILGLEQGEAAVIRNVGGRVTPATLRSLAMLKKVGEAHRSARPPDDWNLVILHHTDCGMTDLAAFPGLLAGYFDIPAEELPAKSVTDPFASVKVDVGMAVQEIRRSHYFVTGLVYDVATGRVEQVVPPTAAGAPS
ncbi:carbonic anhydrase [Actinacidiphila rubida]|uniref:carbonic anhydrase n=1 Tax=Actinacidiphila rubida TaxID=310780 RepID=A0A1H8KAL8_9ACTN|nr:carbonic anhydrase [Actinacidiphila rubida]SEN89478.1 carbonic anhydrase [Actinacidiphila rubida]